MPRRALLRFFFSAEVVNTWTTLFHIHQGRSQDFPEGDVNLLFGQMFPKTEWMWSKLGRHEGARVQIIYEQFGQYVDWSDSSIKENGSTYFPSVSQIWSCGWNGQSSSVWYFLFLFFFWGGGEEHARHRRGFSSTSKIKSRSTWNCADIAPTFKN